MIVKESDFDLIRQHHVHIDIKIDVYDDDLKYIDTIHNGLISSSWNITAQSDVRRTANFVLIPEDDVNTLIEEESLIWINRNIVISVGIKNLRTDEYTYYTQGMYVISTADSTYDTTTNQLSISCSDWMTKLDGTKNGQLNASITEFPFYKEYYEGAEDNFYVENTEYLGDFYYAFIDGYEKYTDGDYIIIKMPVTNKGGDKLKINDLGALKMTDQFGFNQIPAGVLFEGYNYSFRVSSDKAVLTSQIPIEKVEDGVALAYYSIRDGIRTALERLGGITNYQVDDVGEFQAMPQYNKNYIQYREENPLWNNIPYDLEFNVGDNVLSILTTFRDLYPNYEMFFDENGTFICQMIPSQIEDDVYLDDTYLQTVLISENFSYDMTSVKNVTEVFGGVIETDFTAKECNHSEGCYEINVDEYGDTYYAGDRVAVTIDKTNTGLDYISIKTTYTEAQGDHTVEKTVTLPPMQILDEMTDLPLEAGQLEGGLMYVFKIKTKLKDGRIPEKYFYLLAEYQPQAFDILTDGTVSDEDWKCADGTIVKVFSKEYFMDKYGCKHIHFTIDKDSPFTVQKVGELLNVLTGGEFENIQSTSRCINRAIWENWKTSRLMDNITLSILFSPFIDVNKKVNYKRSDLDYSEQYIIDSVSHTAEGGITSITMHRFSPLYMDTLEDYETDREYKQNAVKYVEDHPELSFEQCANDLGVTEETLSKWMRLYGGLY